MSVPRKGKVTFAVSLPVGDWDKFKVGVTWYKTADPKNAAIAFNEGLHAIAWSEALTKHDIAPRDRK